MEREVSADLQEQDGLETSLRPSNLDEYIGQKNLKENLSVFISAAKQRQEAWIMFYCMDHLG